MNHKTDPEKLKYLRGLNSKEFSYEELRILNVLHQMPEGLWPEELLFKLRTIYAAMQQHKLREDWES